MSDRDHRRMNRLLAELSVPPYYNQISIHDQGTTELPEWETGEEPVIASDHALFVSTRNDLAGPVTIRLFEGDDAAGGEMVFEGELSISTGVIEYGTIVGAQLDQLTLKLSGVVQLRVFAQPGIRPATVSVVLAPGLVR